MGSPTIPVPSPQARSAAGIDFDSPDSPDLARFETPTLGVPPAEVGRFLGMMDRALTLGEDRWRAGASLYFWIVVGRFVSELLVAQRFVPTLSQHVGGEARGGWRLWLSDDEGPRRLSTLLRNMPPVVRAAVDDLRGDGWLILDDMLTTVADATIRRIFAENDLPEAIEERDPIADQHVAWLAGLLRDDPVVRLPVSNAVHLMRGVRSWLSRLYDVGRGRPFRLALELSEPAGLPDADLVAPGDEVSWRLSFWLQSGDDPSVRLSAAECWAVTADVQFVDGLRIDQPHDLLLSDLKRAAKLFDPLEAILAEARPTGLDLTTSQAYTFLRETRRVLEESGFGVIIPEWWDRPETRLAARLKVYSDDLPADAPLGVNVGPSGRPALGLDTLVDYEWQVALGRHILTRDELRRLARQRSPLVRLRGHWVEIRPRDIAGANAFLKEAESGEATLREVLRLAYGSGREYDGLPVLGMDADGWVGHLFGTTGDPSQSSAERMPLLPQPESFIGQLRPYQVKGLSWLAFLDRFGLGSCLADDMGLGKTIQLIAILLAEREQSGASPGPTLLIVPTSVVGNWVRELRRFSPTLRVLVHHGIDRTTGKALREQVARYDVVITTYALVHRDRDTLGGIAWWRICLDEAQNIKNPSAKQTAAIRSLGTARRVALTGTPVENRLSELWSIMDFLNPGYLGSATDFRRTFAMNIERYRDRHRVEQLRRLVQPFILRRVKSDPNVIADLPEKLEHKVYCNLTAEQVRLYETTVADALDQADRAEGIQRRGLVLAALVKLKQICNHPAQYLREGSSARGQRSGGAGEAGRVSDDGVVSIARSGKTARLIEMLEEVIAEGDSALVFSQFREMGHLLSSMLRRELGVEVLFLHGGTPMGKREEMIDRFQNHDGTVPIFVLSLKAGGFGLNLTAASHVFHFDRWWNPAVENQATDRAFRIGQTRTVQVHKFICSGTLEERIDEMIEQKVDLAENVIGAGEDWLTELSTEQLRDILSLRHEEVQDEDVGIGAEES